MAARTVLFLTKAAILASCSALAAGCEIARFERHRARPAPAASVAAVSDELRLVQRLAYRRFEVTKRLAGELTRPEKFHEQPCTIDERDPSAQPIVLGSEDVRYEPKHLLPLSLLEQVLGSDLRFSRSASRFAPPPPPPASAREAEQALQELDELARRRYKGVFYITDFASPALVHKIDKPRSEWVPGVLAAWFVLHDLESGAALCQTRIIVRNDVKDEPIRRKLKADIQKRLLRVLGTELRERAAAALSRSTSTLHFPSAGARKGDRVVLQDPPSEPE